MYNIYLTKFYFTLTLLLNASLDNLRDIIFRDFFFVSLITMLKYEEFYQSFHNLLLYLSSHA